MEFWQLLTLIVGSVVSLQIILNFAYQYIQPKALVSDASPTLSQQSKKDLHLVRRIQHIATGVIILAFYAHVNDAIACGAILAGVVFFGTVNFARHRHAGLNDWFIKSCGSMLRKHEINTAPAALYFLLGIMVCVWIFPRQIAMLAIINVTFGDPAAAIIGISIKAPRLTEGKTISGTGGAGLLCAIAGTVACYLINDLSTVKSQLPAWEFAPIAFIVGGMADLLPSNRDYYLDDNFTIPVYSALMYYPILTAFKAL